MRSFAHWTPRYIVNRLAEMRYHRARPNEPWLTRTANEILSTYLKAADVGLEFGSGRSTAWFAGRISRLISVEHNEQWYANVRRMLEDRGLKNVEYHLIPKDREDHLADDAAYVRFLEGIDAACMDFVLIDGVYRDFCALNAIRVVRPGGIIITDNANWFLPCTSYSPNSRTAGQGPKGDTWAKFLESVSSWRRIWTSSGVTDTAIFFKPCH